MQRWCSKLRSLALLRASSSLPSPKSQPLVLHHRRLFHSNHLTKTLIVSRPPLLPSRLPVTATSSLPALMQVRYLTLKQRKRKLKCRQPPSPVVSKLKKIKMKSYSSFKGRFRTMKDGQIRRWKEGKRHNAHQKSKIAKRRGRLPAVVPVAYAKVMKKLNFCG
ncbi:putative ribosomal protein L35 [Helianthus anomalus]